jgi:hypothetical protein
LGRTALNGGENELESVDGYSWKYAYFKKPS